jgi:peptidoglycan/LPS O-acetylase OafA/YrhL
MPPAAPTAATSPNRTPHRLPYIPALDGVRALAVGMVVAYHLGFSRVPGGFVGVEVFFVLSGWLVGALLAREQAATGRVDLVAFWRRRARRLLPALGLVLAATLVAAAVLHYERLVALRADAVGTLAYVLNWRLIADRMGYFEAAATRPSPLRHLWSLSIEEQFYVVLPLALVLALRLARRSAPRAALVMLGLAAASGGLRLLVDASGDVDRLYYGTDTRAAGFLVGVALALVWRPDLLRAPPGRWIAVPLDVVALGALAVVGWYATQVDELGPDAFTWALTAVEAAVAVLVAVLAHPTRGLVARALAVAPLRWVGQRSYGIYLWHWPLVVAWCRAPGEQPAAPPVTVAIVVVTLLAAAVSYRWVERPIRRRGVQGLLGDLGRSLQGGLAHRPILASGATAAAVLAVVAGTVVLKDVVAPSADEASGSTVAAVAPAPSAAPLRPPTTPASTTTTGAASPTPAPAATPAPPAPPPTPRTAPALPPTSAVGDSVMAGAAPVLQAAFGPALAVDAVVGRQPSEAVADIRRLADQGRLGDVVVVHLGANGRFPGRVVDEVADAVGADRQLVLVTVKVPRRWEAEVNATLVDADRRHDNAVLADWHAIAASEPGLLAGDGYHLSRHGAERYAAFLAATVAGLDR